MGPVYSRIGNPTVGVLEERLAALDGGAAALALASGSTAVFSTLLLLGQGGGNIVSAPSLYGAIQAGLVHFLPQYGITTRFVTDVNDVDQYDQLIDSDTKAVYVESLSNPLVSVPDIERIARVAHRHGVPLVVDNTVATPYLLRPLEHGVDVVVYSLTKGISGHGNVIGGAVVENGTFEYSPERFPALHQKWWKDRDRDNHPRTVTEIAPGAPLTTALRIYHLLFLGAKLGPFEAYLVLQGLETLSERLSKQSASAALIAEHLSASPHVEQVHHPSVAGGPDAARAAKYLPRGAGGLVSFRFAGTRDEEEAFIQALRLFIYEANLGDSRSLIIDPPTVTHGELEPEYADLMGVTPTLLRLSIGLEDPRDLVADLDQAFATVFAQ